MPCSCRCPTCGADIRRVGALVVLAEQLTLEGAAVPARSVKRCRCGAVKAGGVWYGPHQGDRILQRGLALTPPED